MFLQDRFPAEQASTLIGSKLVPPVQPTHVVRRPRLLADMERGGRRKVTTVVAPAGFGKTVLVSDWLSIRPHRRVAWVSLDAHDGTPSRFWSYVLAALAKAGTDVPGMQALIATVGAGAPEQTLGLLVNALAELDEDLVLVLDDYHLITDPAIHRDLGFLANRHLARLHVVIVSRTDPPLALARSKAHGHVWQVRAPDLAFTNEEAKAYLTEQGVSLTPELWESLYLRVGGWAAALHLVALWVGDHDDPARAIAQFATGDMTIADYLTSEVLGGLADDLREFLLRTSVLPRLSGPLCDAITGGSQGRAMLRELLRRGLFLESLDGANGWFRYHQLFADLLRNELYSSRPDLVPELHRRASAWFEREGLVADAVEQSIKAADWPTVQRLMLGEVLSIGARYQPAVIENWLELIPGTVKWASPFFQLMHAFALGHIGQIDQAMRAIDRATEQMSAAEPGSDSTSVRILVSVVAGSLARLNCDLEMVEVHGHEVEVGLAQLGDEASGITQMARAAIGNARGATLFLHGDVGAAEFQAVAAQHQSDDQHLVRMHAGALSTRSLIFASTGRLRQADEIAEKALRAAAAVGSSELFQITPAYLAKAMIAGERGHDAEAGERLSELARRADRHSDRGFQFLVAVRMAQHLGRVGDAVHGLTLLRELKSRWAEWKPPTSLMVEADAAGVRLLLQIGDLAAASAVLRRMECPEDSYPGVTVTRQLAIARVQHAERRFAEALASFHAISDLASSAGQISAVIEAQVQAALLQQQMGEDGAQMTMHRALATAQDEGIVATFLEDPRSVRLLLLAVEASDQEFSTRTFRRTLMDRLGVPTQSLPLRNSNSIRPSGLTERELAVLRLLGGSLTSADIAHALGISVNTMKTHTKRIYAKLGVRNRRDAIRYATSAMHE